MQPRPHFPRYFDYQATTPTDPRVVEAMLPYFTQKFGNPHATTHPYGWEAEEAVTIAREEVAALIGARPEEILFTSGATESNNLAIKGIASFYGPTHKKHIITQATEHKCVLESCYTLEQLGFITTILPVQENGQISLEALEKSIRPDTLLVSIMAINNEIGSLQPLKQIGELCQKHQIIFHTDAAQATGKIPIHVKEDQIDVLSISGHKMVGPKGIGALYVRSRPPLRLQPLLVGGGQERGLRAGTIPVPLVVGLGKACHIASQEMERDYQRIRTLSQQFLDGLESLPSGILVNGDGDQRYPGTLNLSFPGIIANQLIVVMRELAVSSGSACASISHEPSYVLQACGFPKERIESAIRFGIGKYTTEEDITIAIEALHTHIPRLLEQIQ